MIPNPATYCRSGLQAATAGDDSRPGGRSYLYVLMLLAGISSVHASEFNQVQAEKSTVAFAYKQMGVPSEGKFRKFAAAVAFDPAKPSAASARIDIDLASIDTGSKEGDDEVMGKQWFHVKSHPQARFVSSAVKALGGNRYEVAGLLTIKGRSREVSAPFTFRREGAAAVFEGGFVLNRLDFAIGEGPWADVGTVANEVRINFYVVASAAPARK